VAFILERVLSLVSNLRAPCVWDLLCNVVDSPCSQTKAEGDDPVRIMKSIFANLEGSVSEFNDDCLASQDNHKDDPVSDILMNSFELIGLIMDNSDVNEVENLHHDEHMEDT